MKKNIILVLGMSGAGKDFVSRLLESYFRTQNIHSLRCSFGDKLRQMNAVKSNGELTDIKVVANVLKELLATEADIYIFDGFPRSEEQLKCLLHQTDYSINVIVLNCSEQIAVKRLKNRFLCPKCKKSMSEDKCDICCVSCLRREDDLDFEVIKRRINIYQNDIAKIIHCLEKNNVNIEYTDAMLGPEIVKNNILKIAHKLIVAK